MGEGTSVTYDVCISICTNHMSAFQVEQVMVAFVESSARQHNLPAMTKQQREIAHEMAQAFSLTTQSFGQDPSRHIRLFKVNPRSLS